MTVSVWAMQGFHFIVGVCEHQLTSPAWGVARGSFQVVYGQKYPTGNVPTTVVLLKTHLTWVILNDAGGRTVKS